MKKENIIIAENNNTQSIVGIMRQDTRMNLCAASITLPDGTKLPFYCNGEQDKELAIKFANSCWNATKNSAKCMALMYKCFMLLANGISPDEVITEYGSELYLDYKQAVIVSGSANVLVSLDKEEKKLFKSKPQIKHLLLEKLKRYFEEKYEQEDEEDCEEDEE